MVTQIAGAFLTGLFLVLALWVGYKGLTLVFRAVGRWYQGRAEPVDWSVRVGRDGKAPDPAIVGFSVLAVYAGIGLALFLALGVLGALAQAIWGWAR